MPKTKDEFGSKDMTCRYCAMDFKVPHKPEDFATDEHRRRLAILDIHLIREAEEEGDESLHRHIALNYSFEETGNKAVAEGGARNKKSWILSQLRNGADQRQQYPDGEQMPIWMAWTREHRLHNLWVWVNSRLDGGVPF